jgi:serine/threonine protein kinase
VELHAYVAYATHGSLHGLLRKFQQRGQPIPEVSIWLVIRNLARACQVLESQDIIHPDMKPDNVFLDDARGPTDYPGYCNPLLGDYDLLPDPNKTFDRNWGTPGWPVHEQL